jgi:tRNA (guanine-N7-)-methyltransferase
LSRPIRSYVLRQGRTTPAQKRALEALLPQYGIPFQAAVMRTSGIFGRAAPLVLEIGSGMGETTAAIAHAHPELDFIAAEVHGPGVGSLLNRIEALGLKNLKVIRHDASEVLEKMIPDSSLAAIHLFFPDPWPKKRHHKRRLVQSAFAALAASRLVPGGILHAATDWPDYADHIVEVLSAEPGLEPAAGGLVQRPATKFEARGQRLGHPIRDLYFRRTALSAREGSSREAR